MRLLIEDLETRVATRTQELEAAMLQVEQSWSEAVEANRMRTVWLSKIAHDLRAPLGIASTALSFMQDEGLGSLNTEQLAWIDKSLKSMRHIADLADSLFDISKLLQYLNLSLNNVYYTFLSYFFVCHFVLISNISTARANTCPGMRQPIFK